METLHALKALADETRLRIVSLLEAGGDLCACEIESVLAINQSNASRHLAKLSAAGLVLPDKRGLWVHYQLDPSSRHTSLAVSLARSAREESERFVTDLERLNDYRSSGFTCQTIGEWVGRTDARFAPARRKV